MAFRIPRHPEAFSKDPSCDRKRPRQKASQHLAFIRTLPCLVCGSRATVQAAHVRMASPAHGKRAGGMQRKPDDKWSVPMCVEHHEDQHRTGNEKSFWSAVGIDPLGTALALFGCTGDETMAEVVIKESRR